MFSITEIVAGEKPPLAAKIYESLILALANQSKIDPSILEMTGMSGKRYRQFINNLVRSFDAPRYLEVGSWMGSTLCSAINNNKVDALAIDNWSEFGGPKEEFANNVEKYKTEDAIVKFIEGDFRSLDLCDFNGFNIYLFDGPHEEKDQYDGLMFALPSVTNNFVFIVDDWNWGQVRDGTFNAIRDANVKLEYGLEIRTTDDGTHPAIWGEHSDWHNGYFVSVLTKMGA